MSRGVCFFSFLYRNLCNKQTKKHTQKGLALIHAKDMHHGDLTLDSIMYYCFSDSNDDETSPTEPVEFENVKVNVVTAGKFVGGCLCYSEVGSS